MGVHREVWVFVACAGNGVAACRTHWDAVVRRALAVRVVMGARQSVVEAKVVATVWAAEREEVELAALGMRTPEAQAVELHGGEMTRQQL